MGGIVAVSAAAGSSSGLRDADALEEASNTMTSEPNPVLDPVTGDYVLPAPLRGQGAGEVIVVQQPQGSTAGLLRGHSVAQALARRFQVQAESLDMFLVEVRERLEQLDVAIAEDSRAQLKGAVREIAGVLEWCEAVQGELATECALAGEGKEPVDVGELCRRLASESTAEATASTTVVGDAELTWWGHAAALAHLVEQALALVAERTHGSGARCIELSVQDSVPCVHVRSHGEPADGVDPGTIARFRAAVEAVGATVVPDHLGLGGAGLVLRLPV